MRYFVKENVTEEQLLKYGYVNPHDYEIALIKRTNDFNVFVNNNREVMVWNKEHIQDLIDAGLVEVSK